MEEWDYKDLYQRSGCFPSMRVGFFLAVLIALMCLLGCKTIHEVHTEYVYQHDTTYVSQLKYDSIYMHDSVFVREKGDSFFKTIYRDVYKYKYMTDTLIKIKTDTIYKTDIKTIEKQLSFCERIKQGTWSGLAIMVLILGFCLLWKIRK